MYYKFLRKFKKYYQQWRCSFDMHDKFTYRHSEGLKICLDCGKVEKISKFYPSHTR